MNSSALDERKSYYSHDLVECTRCGKITSIHEAEVRRFHTGRCAKCDGPLFPLLITPPSHEP